MMSSGKFPDPRETRAYRRAFLDLWSSFLRANFTSTAHVAVVFAVDEATARSWWNGVNCPSGFAVAIAFRDYGPQAMQHLAGGWRRALTARWRYRGALA